ncbi:MAG: PIG-L deacetylase family protein [Bacteroidota bacterium]
MRLRFLSLGLILILNHGMAQNEQPRKCIMVFGAHADDVEYVAGTLAKYIDMGYEPVYVGAINNLAGCNLERPPYFDIGPNFTVSDSPHKYPIGALETIQVREEEAIKGAAVFGTEPVFLYFNESWFSHGRKPADLGTELFSRYDPPGRPIISMATRMSDQVGIVVDLLKKYQPEIVIIHTLGGEKLDHGNSGYMMYLAFKEAMDKGIPVGKLWMTLHGWFLDEEAQKSGRGKPDVRIDVKKYLPVKYEALSKHISQNGGYGKEHARERQPKENYEEFITVLDNTK